MEITNLKIIFKININIKNQINFKLQYILIRKSNASYT